MENQVEVDPPLYQVGGMRGSEPQSARTEQTCRAEGQTGVVDLGRRALAVTMMGRGQGTEEEAARAAPAIAVDDSDGGGASRRRADPSRRARRYQTCMVKRPSIWVGLGCDHGSIDR